MSFLNIDFSKIGIANIDFSKADSVVNYISKPGFYTVKIIDAKSEVDEKSGPYIKIKFENEKGELFINRYNYGHAVESVAALNIKQLGDLIAACGLANGCNEKQLLGKVLGIHLAVDAKSKYMRLISVTK